MFSFALLIIERKGAVKVWNDNEWLQSHFSGDHSAFSTLVEHYQAYVFAIILRFVTDPRDAEDIAQEVFLQLYRSLKEKQPEQLKAWIGKITVNKAIDWKRRQQRQQMMEEYLKPRVSGNGGATTMEEQVWQREQEALLRQLCRGLSPPYRRAIIQYYFQGKSYQEIAREEGISLKTAESRLYRARKMIRQKWEEGQK